MKRLHLVVCVFLLVGCGDGTDVDAGGAVMDSGSPGADSGVALDSGGSDSGTGVALDSGGSDSGTAVDAGPIDAGAPRSCGGSGGGTCDSSEWCDYRGRGNICGAADGTGVCRARPDLCTDIVRPVCGCDGMIYTNACEANAAGVDVTEVGCTVPSGQFACGFRICDETSYCRRSADDTGMPPSYGCTPFPSACDGGGRNCTCVAGEACGDMCTMDADGHVTVTCPGG